MKAGAKAASTPAGSPVTARPTPPAKVPHPVYGDSVAAAEPPRITVMVVGATVMSISPVVSLPLSLHADKVKAPAEIAMAAASSVLRRRANSLDIQRTSFESRNTRGERFGRMRDPALPVFVIHPSGCREVLVCEWLT